MLATQPSRPPTINQIMKLTALSLPIPALRRPV
jgi:hypothetical protein